MTKGDDRDTITSADADLARLRRHCLEASAKYRLDLIAAGHLEPDRKVAA